MIVTSRDSPINVCPHFDRGFAAGIATLRFMRAVRCLPGIDCTLLSRTEHYDPAPAGLEPTVDTFKAGDPDSRVNGIAVTMMATLDVLQRAAAHGDNLIITHEPTFFDHLDAPQ